VGEVVGQLLPLAVAIAISPLPIVILVAGDRRRAR